MNRRVTRLERARAGGTFALTALPTVFVLGIFTFVRLVESSVEDIYCGRAINRIRNYHLEVAGDRASYFMPPSGGGAGGGPPD